MLNNCLMNVGGNLVIPGMHCGSSQSFARMARETLSCGYISNHVLLHEQQVA